MPDYIPKQQLEKKVREFISETPTSLDCYADLHFQDRLIRFPIETHDGKAFEATFCYGYEAEKYLAALSAQVGCATACKFCELADLGLKKNLTDDEIVDQLRIVLRGAYKRGYDIFDRPIKATLVMGGEPLANPYLADAVSQMGENVPLQLKVSTVLPDNKRAKSTYKSFVDVAKDYDNIIQFQISLNSSDEAYRQSLVSIPLADFKAVREAGELWMSTVPDPRKIDLTFTINKDTPLNSEDIRDILPPDLFAIRLRECVPTKRAREHDIEKVVDGQLASIKKQFEDDGYMVIPGSPGSLEWKFKLAPGELLKLYEQMRNGG